MIRSLVVWKELLLLLYLISADVDYLVLLFALHLSLRVALWQYLLVYCLF
jgi:hypothetical protein